MVAAFEILMLQALFYGQQDEVLFSSWRTQLKRQ